MDDYAHHPTEIKATLNAIPKNPESRLIIIFQPHRYTRTKLLYKEFGKVFTLADKLIITDIYPAGEIPISGVDASLIVNEVRKNGQDVEYISKFEEIIEYLKNIVKVKDIIITLGAGNIYKVSEELVKILKEKERILG
jgi:UDP-N-acetylmuramate--alanine ligase